MAGIRHEPSRASSFALSAVLAVAALLAAGCQHSDSGERAAAAERQAKSENPANGKATSDADRAPQNGNVVNAGVSDDAPMSKERLALVAEHLRQKPNEILGRMIQAYHTANSYADAAQLRISIERIGQPANDPEPMNASVSFVRPNKVRIQCLDAMMVSDGKKLRASVGSVADQVLELEAPPNLSIGNLYLGDAFSDSLARGVGGFPIQLALLLDDTALTALVPEGSTISPLPPENFDGHSCARLKVEMPDGARVYWIDAETFVLRKVELPTDLLRKQIEASEGPVKGVSVTLELFGARLNQPVPEAAFQFEIPAGAKLVKQLLRPPHPVSEMLGKKIPEFKFTGINGSLTSSKTAAGKVTVLAFWFTGCDPCRESFPQLAKVFEKYKGSSDVAIVGVSVDRPEVGDERIQQIATGWGATFPICRDTSEQFQSAFHGMATPALFVIGPDGTVQYNEIGLNPDLVKELPETIDAILAGKSTWEVAKARGTQREADYQRKIQEPPTPFTAVEDLPATKILPRDEPKSIKLTKVWESTELKAPGNILVVDGAGADPKMYVLDGPRTVVELSRDRQIAARHELKIPEQAVITFLRTTVDKQGHRYFAGSSTGQQQLFLFDADWKPLLSFPAADQGKHAGIGDVQFVDLEEIGSPKLAVGYWGIVGVQMISLDGNRLWTDRAIECALSMTESGADAKGLHTLLCTNSRGSLVPIDATGAEQTAWAVPGLMLETVLAADVGEPHKSLCAIASNAEGTSLAVGLGPRGEDFWRYVLPRGIFRTPVERLTVANLIGEKPQWLLAGPDGSIHFVANDGTPLDHFHYGEALTGIASARFGAERLLLVSTAKGLTAWRVEAK